MLYNALFLKIIYNACIFILHLHLDDSIVSQRGEAWTYNTSLTPPLFALKFLFQARKVSGHVFVFYGINMPLSTILIFDFEIFLSHCSNFCFSFDHDTEVVICITLVPLKGADGSNRYLNIT